MVQLNLRAVHFLLDAHLLFMILGRELTGARACLLGDLTDIIPEPGFGRFDSI